MSQPSLLHVSGLSYRLHSRQLLDDINVEIQPGELVGIIGPNGAGKSTLLKCLIDFLPASDGQIRYNGKALHELTHQQRALEVAYMAQHPEASFPFSAAEVIALGAENRRQITPLSPQLLNQQITVIARELQIEPLLQRKITELSGGERQLVHFARVLMQQTPLLLLDEPSSNLDIGHETWLMQRLKSHCAKANSALIALHNLTTAATFCERLLFIAGGRLIASGKPEQVLTEARIAEHYHQQVIVAPHPVTGTLTVMPVQNTNVRFK
ncbi:ABC transporter ATP-binding protein [Reinekea marinisedimentorum]|uniref:Iron complex transport system ATP-binding protein n=1 Tax=Reinekea marinisedimentorum TaxID=230495 RepID=A0A4R3ICG6_9GAMM|nr:ATP-binding cassette domain-containing protein [Reinekea marinisedimentorum]TCS43256.1 iron complex transport system ATP-binding protein [Reinekea marinisedimentorum]